MLYRWGECNPKWDSNKERDWDLCSRALHVRCGCDFPYYMYMLIRGISHWGKGVSVSFLKCFCYKIMLYSLVTKQADRVWVWRCMCCRKEIKDRGQTVFPLFQDLGKPQILQCLCERNLSFMVFLTGHWKTKADCFGNTVSQLCWNLTFLGKEVIEARTLLASQRWVVLLSVMLALFAVACTRRRIFPMQGRRQDCWVIADQSPWWKMSFWKMGCGEKWNCKATSAGPGLWPGEQVPDIEGAASKYNRSRSGLSSLTFCLCWFPRHGIALSCQC